jgi:hypothetical protein
MRPTRWRRSSTCSTPIVSTNSNASTRATHLTLYRGINRIDEHEVLERGGDGCYRVLLNNLNSFTSVRERADEFGDYILCAQVPLPKILFYNSLLPGMLKGEDEFVVIGGVYEVAISTFARSHVLSCSIRWCCGECALPFFCCSSSASAGEAPLPMSTPALTAVLTPALRRLLAVVLLLAGLLAINSVYLVSVTLAEWAGDRGLQNAFYLDLFLAHLVLGLLLLVPALLFGALHFRRARRRPNRYAIRAGLGLYLAMVALFASGLALTRFGFFEVDDPLLRGLAYWVHVLAPLAVLWLFVLHRLAGPRLRWRAGVGWAVATVACTGLALTLHLSAKDDSPVMVRAFEPALAKVPAPGTIPARHLMVDAVCTECHAQIGERHAGSMHRLSSFNNPAYRFSIEETRAEILARDGDVRATRLCAVCHDQVPLFSGRFDAVDYDPDLDPGAAAGITCLGCHAITAINSPRGNGDYSLATRRAIRSRSATMPCS